METRPSNSCVLLSSCFFDFLFLLFRVPEISTQQVPRKRLNSFSSTLQTWNRTSRRRRVFEATSRVFDRYHGCFRAVAPSERGRILQDSSSQRGLIFFVGEVHCGTRPRRSKKRWSTSSNKRCSIRTWRRSTPSWEIYTAESEHFVSAFFSAPYFLAIRPWFHLSR